jgi:microcin C transport system ATP-binding protein
MAARPSGRPTPVERDAKTILSTDDLKVHFPITTGLFKRTVDYVRAVDGVSCTLRRGQTIGLVGESGSGKSTFGLGLLRLVQSDGPIVYLSDRIDGLSERQMRQYRSQMQIVFQDPYGALSPRMSVERIIGEGLAIHAKDLSHDQRVEKIVQTLRDVGLDPETRHRFPHEFSGGQRQRIAIARAMVLEPDFVVLDEPTSALDMSVQAQVVDLLRGLQDKYDLAYLFISHDLAVIKCMAHHVMVMKGGKIVEEGGVDDIFNQPQTDYTKTLLDSAFI